MPNGGRAEELLARWREAERRHAGTEPGSLEFEITRLEVVEIRRTYQRAVDAVDAVEEFDLAAPQRVPTAVD